MKTKNIAIICLTIMSLITTSCVSTYDLAMYNHEQSSVTDVNEVQSQQTHSYKVQSPHQETLLWEM